MGLSGRRRARKEIRGRTQVSVATDARATMAAESDPDRHQLNRSGSRHPHSGNTYRRLCPAFARDRKHASLLAFELNRRWSNDLLPGRQATHPEIGAEPNANLHNRDMLHLMDADYNSHVAYSLDKQKRWKFPAQLVDSYQSSEELKAQSFFLVESVAQGARGGTVRRVTTNARYITEAADELRQHKRKLQAKFSHQPKQLVTERDRFEFSEEVRQKQAERPLSSISSASRGGAINAKSIRRSGKLWNQLHDVSPRAEEVRLDMQRDYEGRVEVVVGTCVPCRGVDVSRFRHAESEIREYRPNRDTREYNWHHGYSLMKRVRRSDLDLQLELDGEAEVLQHEFADASDTEESDRPSFQRSAAAVTLFDAMRLQDCDGPANQAKKLAMKARKMRKALQSRKKLRNDSDQTVGSSGYDSGPESREDAALGEADKEASVANARLAAAVDAALEVARPLVQVPREAADAARLISLFVDTGAEGALAIGNSLPRKLAIMLLPDLSESVVFEEAVAQERPGCVTYAVRHACSGAQVPRTSVQEVTSQADPFAFLRSLVAAPLNAAPRSIQDDGEKGSSLSAIGWRRAEVRTETVARLTAVQALPMFSVSAADANDDVELVPGTECEICCLEFDAQPQDSKLPFARGSTTLIQCGHSFCNRCWLQHVASRVASGRVDIACPGYGCQSALDAATLLWFCPGEFLPALSAAAFRAWLADRRQGRQRRLCPRRNCGVLECPAGVNAVCAACAGSLCLGCGQEPHWPVDCDTATRYRTKLQQLGHSNLRLQDLSAHVKVSAKQCPTCQLLMEKGVGCNHMSCPCGEQFCWWCGRPMRVHSAGTFCSDTVGRIQSGFQVERDFTAAESILVPSSAMSRMYCKAVRLRLHRESRKHPATLEAVVGLFLSYAIRCRSECRDNWAEAGRFARRTARCLTEASVQASFLAEYAFVHMDSHRRDKRARTVVVRALGGHVGQLATGLMTEVDEQCRGGYRGPRLTRVGCERLLLMVDELRRKCRLLSIIVVRLRDRSSLL